MTAAFTAGSVLTATNLNNAVNTLTINAQTAAGYTLVLTDGGKLVTLSNASAQNLTIPLNSSVAFPTGTVIEALNIGTGTWTVTATGGVTLSGTTAIPTNGRVRLTKTGTDTWWSSAMDTAAGGLAFIATSTFSSASSVNVNNCFSSAYLAYRLVMSISSSDGLGYNMRMRGSGSDDTSTQYRLQQISAASTTLAGVRPATGTSWSIGATANPELMVWDFIDPAVAASTRASHIAGVSTGGEPELRVRYFIHSVSTAYDGFSLTPFTGGQTISGRVSIFGYHN